MADVCPLPTQQLFVSLSHTEKERAGCLFLPEKRVVETISLESLEILFPSSVYCSTYQHKFLTSGKNIHWLQ